MGKQGRVIQAGCMTTATQQRQAGAYSVPTHVAGVAPRWQVRLATVLVSLLATATVVGAIALGRDDHRASGRFAVPHFNDAKVVKGTFGDPQVVKGARGGTFGDPDVRKGAAGAPLP